MPTKPEAMGLFAEVASSVSLTGTVQHDVVALLTTHGCPGTATHCLEVGAEAERVAQRFGLNAEAARCAGLLHDVSAIYPNRRRLDIALQLGLSIHQAERAAPMLLHQRISAEMARRIFFVDDRDVLDAIACHTTLKAGASPLCKAVFVADKIAWDQPGTPPWYEDIQHALSHSLDEACRVYLRWLWERRATLAAVHPWFEAAHAGLCANPEASS